MPREGLLWSLVVIIIFSLKGSPGLAGDAVAGMCCCLTQRLWRCIRQGRAGRRCHRRAHTETQDHECDEHGRTHCHNHS